MEKLKNTIIVNLYGSKNSGKSVMAANIFSELKWKNISCELITNCIKDKLYDKQCEYTQFYNSAVVYNMIEKYKGKVDVIVTDSPLLLGLSYCDNEPDAFKELLLAYYEQFNNLDVFIHRDKLKHQDELCEKDKQIYDLFTKYCSSIGIIHSSAESAKIISDLIIKKLENEKEV